MKRNSRTIDWVLEILSAHSLDQDLEDILLTGTLRETDRTVLRIGESIADGVSILCDLASKVMLWVI